MVKKIFCAGIVLCFFVLLGCDSWAEDEIFERKLSRIGQKFVSDEIIVKFKPGVRDSVITELNKRLKTVVVFTSERVKFKRIRIPKDKTVPGMIAEYKRDPNVEYAEPNFIAYAHTSVNDPYYSYQWHLDNAVFGGINIEGAWDVTSGDSSVIVAVVDTGVAYENYSQIVRRKIVRYYQAPDLAGTNFVAGKDFVNNDTHPNDDEGHGTHVTGTIAQTTNNGLGVAGVAYNCSIMPVKVLDQNGTGTYSDIAEGIIYAADNGARVINMSLGGGSDSVTLKNAVAYAYNKGVTIVCSSGNDGSPDTISFPAAYDEYCIAVGATRFDEEIASYSNRGVSLDIVAPGGDVNVDQNGDGYGDGVLQQTFGSSYNDFGYYFYMGTSMAAPHVSGVAALLLSAGIATTPDDVREALQSTAEDKGPVGWDPGYGWGIVDANAALHYSPEPNIPPVADAGGPYNGKEDETVLFDGSGSYDADDDTLTFFWDFGDGTSGAGVSPSHEYGAGGTYDVTLIVNDGREDSLPSNTYAVIEEVNDSPVAVAGADQTVSIGETVIFDASASYDPDGTITSYEWDFGDSTFGAGVNVTHEYPEIGTYVVTLTVTDNNGATASDTSVVTVTQEPDEIEVFFDSFEDGQWNGLWNEDSQNDWFCSTQRAVDGSFSAEADGFAADAKLISVPIDLQGKSSVSISFSWYIEKGLDMGEYLAFDISTDDGINWVEKARLNGNADAENVWHDVTVDLNGISSLMIRFRAKMSVSNEDANVDGVRVLAR